MPESGREMNLIPHLLFLDRDISSLSALPWNKDDILKDLEVNSILDRMAGKDEEVRGVCQQVILSPLQETREITYRQDVVRDSLRNRDSIRKMRSVLVEAVKEAREKWFWMARSSRNPELSLHESLSILSIYLSALSGMRELSRREKENFTSDGFSSLFSVFIDVFDEEYSNAIMETLSSLRFPGGVRVRGKLGLRNEFTGFMLLKPEPSKGFKKAVTRMRERKYTYVLPPRDEHGPIELANLRSRAIMSVVKVLEEAGNNVLNFITSLSSELAFLEGCINLAESLESIGAGFCFPVPLNEREKRLQFTGLYDMALSVKLGKNAVPNDLPSGVLRLTIVTGANRGGKSTFLRSIGQAVLMMQAGMFIGASEFSSSLFKDVFTHFKREEDKNMEQGKFDEELGRMDEIVNHIEGDALILFNESFSATNAREGAEIAGEIVDALISCGMAVIFVTHMNELADYFMGRGKDETSFLVAERTDNGERTFRILPGKPENTSHGTDLYAKVFGEPLEEHSRVSAQRQG